MNAKSPRSSGETLLVQAKKKHCSVAAAEKSNKKAQHKKQVQH